MKICFFTPAFPGKHDSSHYAFVKQLVDAIAKQGHECHVVVPYNYFHYKKITCRYESYDVGVGKVIVYRPYYVSLSNNCFVFKWINKITRDYALKKAIKKLPPEIDVVYCHFWVSGYRAYPYAKKNNIPLFIATGESEINKLFDLPHDIVEFRNCVNGVICVSSKNKNESIQLGLTTEDKCGIFPNAVNEDLFKKRDKAECRKQLGLPQKDFIVAFVGWFDERKGSNRVSEAIDCVGNVKSVFIGKGALEPNCKGVLFKGPLSHDKVPLYLSAADCFVLPTQAEGCCNAVIEAMACGLPVVSSNLPFNWDVLDNSNSIMVNPNSISEISEAIRVLRDDEKLRLKLSEGALQKAEKLTIAKRADAILHFINNKIGEINQSKKELIV